VLRFVKIKALHVTLIRYKVKQVDQKL